MADGQLWVAVTDFPDGVEAISSNPVWVDIYEYAPNWVSGGVVGADFMTQAERDATFAIGATNIHPMVPETDRPLDFGTIYGFPEHGGILLTTIKRSVVGGDPSNIENRVSGTVPPVSGSTYVTVEGTDYPLEHHATVVSRVTTSVDPDTAAGWTAAYAGTGTLIPATDDGDWAVRETFVRLGGSRRYDVVQTFFAFGNVTQEGWGILT